MKRKVFRNIFLLLLIPLVITFIIVLVNKPKNEFNGVVSYDKKQLATDNTATVVKEKDERDIVQRVNEDYTYIMFTAFTLVIIFSIFYFYLTRKKEW